MSFKKAALELCVTPTAISHQIRLLERYCGCTLFRRRPRPLALTDAGARLFPAIRGGLEVFATAIAAVKWDSDQQPLRVTTTNAFASRWLVPRLSAWRKLHPDVPLEVIGTDTLLDLQAGEGDVAIRYATSRAVPTDGIADDLLRDTFWPVYNPRLLSKGRLKRPVDLAEHVYMDAARLQRDFEGSDVTGTAAGLYPALLQRVFSLRAPMDSADSRLISAPSSRLFALSRFGESRSDLFCHHSQVPAQPFDVPSSDYKVDFTYVWNLLVLIYAGLALTYPP
ncbi:LysR family transcriptional regulator [Paraburkholderia aromaticivorans]|uniref:LysR family transcriptional regulator n=1 Tax=Paraburkholderia aromaticivorans TaxID=2026199 RepID=UPI001F104F32|nr:LysR family transcriptional regulator [Paraburkholderia aromaticivorans]